MNTEQLKTKKTIEEFMTEAGAKAVSEVAKTLLDFHSKHPVKELSDFASQESKRALDEFKEKLKREIREKSIVLYDASARFALVDGLNTMIDKL